MGRAVTRGFESLGQLHLKIQKMLANGPEMLRAPYITLEGGEGPFPVSKVELSDDMLMFHYDKHETGITSETLDTIVATGISVRGLDYDEEDFRFQMMDVSSDHYREQFSAGKQRQYWFGTEPGPWYSRDVLEQIRTKEKTGEPVTDDEYYWLASIIGLWSMEVDFTNTDQSTTSLLEEVLRFNTFLAGVPYQGAFDLDEMHDLYQSRLAEGWDAEEFDLITQGNDVINDEGQPDWSSGLMAAMDECGRGEGGTRIDQALRQFLPVLISVVEHLHERFHPDTGYTMSVNVR